MSRDGCGCVEEDATAVDHDLLKVVEVVDEAVRRGLADEWPELLGGLEFGRVRRQEQGVDAGGPHDVLALVPARSVENEDDALVLSGTNGFSEAGKRDVEGRDVHCWEQEPLHRTRRRSNEAVEVEPLVSEVLPDERALAALSPDAPRRWLQSDTSFVLCPDFDTCFGDDTLDVVDERLDLFLKASCASRLAAPCCVCGCCSE